jgi:hypothetical protein
MSINSIRAAHGGVSTFPHGPPIQISSCFRRVMAAGRRFPPQNKTDPWSMNLAAMCPRSLSFCQYQCRRLFPEYRGRPPDVVKHSRGDFAELFWRKMSQIGSNEMSTTSLVEFQNQICQVARVPVTQAVPYSLCSRGFRGNISVKVSSQYFIDPGWLVSPCDEASAIRSAGL